MFKEYVFIECIIITYEILSVLNFMILFLKNRLIIEEEKYI